MRRTIAPRSLPARRLAWIVALSFTVAAGCGPAEDVSEDELSSEQEGEREMQHSTSRVSMARVIRLARTSGRVYCKHLVTAGAVAKAESGLNARAYNKNGPTRGCSSGSIDRGLWQINSCYWPKYGNRSCGYDPACNAKGMGVISSRGTTWRPWWAYRYGMHKKFLPEARDAYRRVCRDLGCC